ncbi:ankyrin [Microthyrium microscopicum]|uniref:Ankyrin n=1 Tax=Microthyrium microscopicum TaxID=703497 RepID=A0A6A6UHY1_9PEZI|nr:ankyrin [Microthyrium microscopicum]
MATAMADKSSCELTESQRFKEAVKTGDIRIIHDMLDAGFDINHEDRYDSLEAGTTALHTAIRYERIEVLKLLLQKGATAVQVFYQDHMGFSGTALQFAAEGQKSQCLKVIFEHCRADIIDQQLANALFGSIQNWTLDDKIFQTIKLILEQGLPEDVISEAIIILAEHSNDCSSPTLDPWFQPDQVEPTDDEVISPSDQSRGIELLDVLLEAGGQLNYRHSSHIRHSSGTWLGPTFSTALIQALHASNPGLYQVEHWDDEKHHYDQDITYARDDIVDDDDSARYLFVEALVRRGASVILSGVYPYSHNPLALSVEWNCGKYCVHLVEVAYQEHLEQIRDGVKDVKLDELVTTSLRCFNESIEAWEEAHPKLSLERKLRDYRNGDGDCLVLLATRHGNLPVVKVLVETYGLDPDTANKEDVTPFLASIPRIWIEESYGDNVTSYLLTKNVNLLQQTTDKLNALDLISFGCMQGWDQDTVDQLLQLLYTRGINVNSKCIRWTRSIGFLQLCPPHSKNYIENPAFAAAYTPLNWAILYRSVKMVEWLVSHGADVNQRNGNNETPIMQFLSMTREYRRIDERAKICQLLVAAGADIKARNAQGQDVKEISHQVQFHYDFERNVEFEEEDEWLAYLGRWGEIARNERSNIEYERSPRGRGGMRGQGRGGRRPVNMRKRFSSVL